ncbi:ATP-binding protein [Dermabacteraceae bacterium P9123]
MITKVHIRGYRKFKELVLKPHHEINIIVGANEAGKSTLLEAVTMVLTGKFEGVAASEALNPYWFNMELVDASIHSRIRRPEIRFLLFRSSVLMYILRFQTGNPRRCGAFRTC